jgi:ribulose-5-phosphate 4-epimerase/fuculose-1-phosphate aldolase
MTTQTECVDVNAVLAKHHGRLAFGPRPQEADEMADVRRAVAEMIATQRGCRDMLREAAKQFRLNGDSGHAVMCDRHADVADAALARMGGNAISGS